MARWLGINGRGAGTLWRLAECDKSLGKHDRVIGIPKAGVREPSKKNAEGWRGAGPPASREVWASFGESPSKLRAFQSPGRETQVDTGSFIITSLTHNQEMSELPYVLV